MVRARLSPISGRCAEKMPGGPELAERGTVPRRLGWASQQRETRNARDFFNSPARMRLKKTSLLSYLWSLVGCLVWSKEWPRARIGRAISSCRSSRVRWPCIRPLPRPRGFPSGRSTARPATACASSWWTRSPVRWCRPTRRAVATRSAKTNSSSSRTRSCKPLARRPVRGLTAPRRRAAPRRSSGPRSRHPSEDLRRGAKRRGPESRGRKKPGAKSRGPRRRRPSSSPPRRRRLS